jgi:hypothetical protein
MTVPAPDTRSAERKARDEQIAAEPPLAVPAVSDKSPKPVESFLSRTRRPVAYLGVVENGVIRPLDPTVTLAEHSRVIIVAQDAV